MTNNHTSTPPAPQPHVLRLLNLERLSADDWRTQIAGWWIICVRKHRHRTWRPMFVVPACWLLTAATYAQIDGGDKRIVVDNIPIERAPDHLRDELLTHLRIQCRIDDTLLQITSASR
jgi:hypothetical protein